MSANSHEDVTVVISTFNRCAFLPEAIESILSQTISPKRVIVVDDGSTDTTRFAVQPYLGEVEYFYKENGGKARALNSVLASIESKYVWFFDDDDAAYPSALSDLISKFNANDNLGFVFGSFDVAKTDGPLLDANARSVAYGYSNDSNAQQRLRLFRECTVMMSGSLIKTDLVRALGGLNEELVRCQDYDLMVRLAAISEFEYCGSSVYVWREHEGLRGTESNRHADQNRVKVWAKFNEPIGLFIRYRLSIDSFASNGKCQLLTSLAIRESLINRAWVLGPKLPLLYAVSDIKEAFQVEVANDLSPIELDTLSNIFHHDFVSYRQVGALFKLVSLCKSYQGCIALIHISKGIYWIGRCNGRFIGDVRFVSVSLILMSIARFFKAFLRSPKSI